MAPSLWLFFAMLCAARGDERRFDQLFLSDDNNGSEYATGMYAGVRENSPYNNATADTMEERVEARVINIPGDFILGGLFPVHKRSVTSAPCGEIQAQRGIQRLEAMLYAVDHVNANAAILPHIRLGASVLDTCSRGTYAVEQSLEYVRAFLSHRDAEEFRCADGSMAIATGVSPAVIGVVGGSYSTVSARVANLLRLFKIPQISYASTSAALSDKGRFEFFARTVPPDNLQAKAMADIVNYFNWTYISTVASSGEYGEQGIDSFQREARARNICIAVTAKLPHSSKPSHFETIVRDLQRKPTARVVVLFLRVEDARQLLLAAKSLHADGQFVWIASDGWGKQDIPVLGNEGAAEGALTIELQSSPLGGFDDYFRGLHPATNRRNPWFDEFWEHAHNCHFRVRGQRSKAGMADETGDNRTCTGHERLPDGAYNQGSKIPFVFNAVYAFAHALHNVLQDACSHITQRSLRIRCMKSQKIVGDTFYKQYILNVSFPDDRGDLVAFDEHGDGVGRYNIMNFRQRDHSGTYDYFRVGHWANGLSISDNAITWAGGSHVTPTSRCSAPCARAQIKHVQQGDSCCWLCTSCKPWEYVRDSNTCADCGEGWWPTDDVTGCFRLPQQYMRFDDGFAVVPLCLSSLGIVMTVAVMLTFARHIDTPIVKASGRELSYLLLSGFLVCYLMTFVFLAKPSTMVCAVQRVGTGFGLSLVYASLLTKTNRIARIFRSAGRSAKRPPFISPKSQVTITLVLVSVQLLYTGAWLVLDPAGTRQHHPKGRRDIIVLKCQRRDQSFLLSLVYIMLLIATCTVYAVKTRKIPENFNESKCIGFAMYTTCVVWLAFVPLYFGTFNSFQIHITTLCVAISLSASVTLLCLFGPKMYLICFHPNKNVHRPTARSTSYSKFAGKRHNRNGQIIEQLDFKSSKASTMETENSVSVANV